MGDDGARGDIGAFGAGFDHNGRVADEFEAYCLTAAGGMLGFLGRKG